MVKQQRPPRIKATGLPYRPIHDAYHAILTCFWWVYLTGFAATVMAVNAFFAGLYMLRPGCIANARPESFADAFFFSVETLATIGYGSMSPATTYGHVIVTIEAIIGSLCFALATGLTFAKFARPTAQVLFTSRLVMGTHNGTKHLMLRVGNTRRNLIVEAQLRVLLLLEETTTEGFKVRTPIPVPLVLDRQALFAMTWTAMHRVTTDSPFADIERLRRHNAEIFVALTGVDGTFSTPINAHYRFTVGDIVHNARFREVLTVHEDGVHHIDYRRFHDVEPQ